MSILPSISILIKTVERPYCLHALLTSLQKMGLTDCPILIADDSRHPYRAEMLQQFGDLITEYITLPFDFGTSAGRNTLVERVKTPYFLLCDDDFVFDKRADLALMHDILHTTEIELLGGMFYNRVLRVHGEPFLHLLLKLKLGMAWRALTQHETVQTFFGRYEIKDQTWYVKPVPYTPPYTTCDFVNNFFMAKTAAFRERGIQWDARLKQLEHEPFFLVAKRKGLKVAVSKEVGVVHRPIVTPTYNQFRQRPEYKRQFMRENGLTRYVDEIRGIEIAL